MEILIGVLTMGLAVVFQTAVFSRINLLSGNIDVVLIILAAWASQPRIRKVRYWALMAGLLVGIISDLPWFVPVIVYMVVVELGTFFKKRVWQAPLLAVFAVVFLGTILMHLSAYLVLRLSGSLIAFTDAFMLVVLPSVILNLLLSIPVHGLVHELAVMLYPAQKEA